MNLSGTLAAAAGVAVAPDTRRLIPFEQSFAFELRGLNRVLKQTVVVSVEAAFTATSIGYGFVPEVQALTFGPNTREIFGEGGGSAGLDQITFDDVIRAANRVFGNRSEFSTGQPAGDSAARIGFQLNPDVAAFALQGGRFDDRGLARLFRVVSGDAGEVLFRYALFDEGTGRAFQSEPVLNLAGLGTSKGDRPFRHFAPPIFFAPKSTIGIEITEISNHVGGLFISLQGYKVLGATGTPTATGRARRGRR